MGEFASFLAALLLMYGPAKKLSRVNANLQQAVAASERIFEMLDIHTEVTEKPGCAAAGAVPSRDRVPRGVVRIRRKPGPHSARREPHACPSGSWWPSWAGAAPARPR